MYVAFIVPFRICFHPQYDSDWNVVDIIVDILFLIDMRINFLTAYIDNEDNLIADNNVSNVFLKVSHSLENNKKLYQKMVYSWFIVSFAD